MLVIVIDRGNGKVLVGERGRSARIVVEDAGGSNELTGDVVYGFVVEAPKLGMPRGFKLSSVRGLVERGRVLCWVWTIHVLESVRAVGRMQLQAPCPAVLKMLNDVRNKFNCRVMS